MNDDVLRRFAADSPLEYIHLGNCTGISADGVRALTASCRKLRHIDLSYCSRAVTESTVRELCKLPLETLRLRACSELNKSSVQLLLYATSCPDLSDLDLSYCDNLPSSTVANILYHHTHLRKIDISKLPLDSAIPRALQTRPNATQLRSLCLKASRQCSEADLIALLRSCPQLESLNLSQMQRIEVTDKVIECIGPTMRKLYLEKSNITDHSLQHLARTCHKLIKLDISHCLCIAMSEEAAPDWPRGCPDLQYLSLEHCKYAESRGVQRLGMLSGLRFLNIAECVLCNDQVLACIADGFPWLQHLVFGFNKISETQKQHLHSARPELQIEERTSGVGGRAGMAPPNQAQPSIYLRTSAERAWKRTPAERLFADHRT